MKPSVPLVLRRILVFRLPPLRTETLALLASAWFALACNGSFWKLLLAQAVGTPGWLLLPGSFLFVTSLQWLLLLLVLTRWTARPLLALLFLTSAATVYFMDTFHVYMDPPMVRNVLETDWHETRDLLSWRMVPYGLLLGVLPSLLVWRIPLHRPPWRHSLHPRPVAMLLALLLAGAGLASVSQTLVPLVREQKTVRYLVTPGNYVYSLLRVTLGSTRAAATPRETVGGDARPGASWQRGRKPVALVIVVGETVRADNWGLDGYVRQTTPELATRHDVVNFSHVSSCGTNTETSLPCMFSAWGRENYDEDRIRHAESLLHVVTHAGVAVQWRDNQSGCKGVCADLPQLGQAELQTATLCGDGRCFDAVLLQGLDALIDQTPGNLVIVLHQMGNHGPAYYQRYPEAFRRYTPTCDTTELGECTPEEIVNTYDNAVLYTDHVLKESINLLATRQTHDTALVYLSDHGESLGEHNLYLHSLPYAIAPETQTHVPMVLWLSPGFAAGGGIDTACLARHADDRLSHDNLFHTVLGLLDIDTGAYDPARDLTAPCRHPVDQPQPVTSRSASTDRL